MTLKKILFALIPILFSSTIQSQLTVSKISSPDKNYTIKAISEVGFVNVLSHKIQFSNSGTYFDYRKDGGQDVLFPVKRYSVELNYKQRNTFVFLFQPLRLQSQVLLAEDLVVDDLTFAASTSVNLLYNFPFYRFSYLRSLKSNNNKFEFALGGSLQIRNATISFESADGLNFRSNRDIGLVPALKLKAKRTSGRTFIELEADGIYAPVSYLNGSDNEIVGAILDASLRAGIEVNTPIKAFINFRYLGGGAVGTSDDDKGPGDGYVKNWLSFGSISLGGIYEWQ